MKRPFGIKIIVIFLSLLPFVLIAMVGGLSWESLKWTVILGLAPFSTAWLWWMYALWHHRNLARWLLVISVLMFIPLWLLQLSVATTAQELWHNRLYLYTCWALLIYVNLPKVRRWFLQPSPEREADIDFDQADYN